MADRHQGVVVCLPGGCPASDTVCQNVITPLASRSQAPTWHPIASGSSSNATVAAAAAGAQLVRDRKGLAGRDTQVDSKTCDERKERAYERLRATQCDTGTIVATMGTAVQS